MKTHRLTGVTLFLCAAALAGAGPAPADTELVARLISFLGISATPIQMKAPDPLTVGDIWIADAGRYAAAQRALERIEAAAILEPDDLRDGTGQPVRQQSAAVQ